MKVRTRKDRPVRRPDHRWCVPPVLLRVPGEILDGAGILDDDRTEAGLVLWTCVRDVTLWASTAPDRREGLFPPEAPRDLLERIAAARLERDPEIALTTLCAVLEMPATVNPEIVGLVCHQIARWAESRGRLAAAIAYAVAASAAQPEEGACAREVGRLAMQGGHLSWAETWLRRAIGLARQGKDWEAYGLAYLDLGDIHVRRGLPERAALYFRAASRTGRRQGLGEVRAAAFHGLARIRLEQPDGIKEAEAFAGIALRAYGRDHVRLPDVLHDLARIWIAAGTGDRAITVLRRELTRREEPERRVAILALLARAAAGAAVRSLYETSWRTAWSLLDDVTVAAQDSAAGTRPRRGPGE